MIKLKNLSKEYKIGNNKSFYALKDINLEIKKGEFVAICGPSGSGKSTLMHIIGLLDKPTAGKVYLEGKDTSKLYDNEISQLRNEFIGFVFQQFNLIAKLSVLENIILPSLYYRGHFEKLVGKEESQSGSFPPLSGVRMTSPAAKERAYELLKRFAMLEKANFLPNKLSGGEQQRVAIARALINNPQIILADEPTGNIDTKTGEKIIDLLEELNTKDKITLLVVTHEKHVAERARREIRIRDGEII